MKKWVCTLFMACLALGNVCLAQPSDHRHERGDAFQQHSNRYEGHRPGKHGYKAGKPDFKSNETRQHSDKVKHGQGEPGKKFRKSRHTSEKQMSSEADVTQTVSDAEDSGD